MVMQKTRNTVIALATVLALTVPVALAETTDARLDTASSVHNQIRKLLVTIPSYGIFDNLEFDIDGNTVTLYGQVLRSDIRRDAERRVRRIEGVEQVINNIRVLPLSEFDNSIRRRTYRAVFRTSSMYRYALGANPSIHIIVDSGHVTLVGVVRNDADKRLARIYANGVSGVFSVTDRLRVEKSGS
jgi:hyperosmotically inducible periplasmic protein